MNAQPLNTCRPSRPAGYLTGGLIVLCLAGALAGCTHTSTGPPQRAANEHDAAIYNTQLGLGYLNQGNIPVAKERLDRALSENPKDPNVHSALAMLYDRAGDAKKADAEFRSALGIAPRDPDIQNNYAVYLCRTGRTADGVRYFEMAAHNPAYRTPEAAYTNAGVCLRSAKQDEKAKPYFAHALELRPNFAEAAFQLSELEFQGGHLAEARTQIDTFVQAFKATPDLLLLGVRVTRALNDRIAAQRYAQKLRMDFPDSDQAKVLAELDRNRG